MSIAPALIESKKELYKNIKELYPNEKIIKSKENVSAKINGSTFGYDETFNGIFMTSFRNKKSLLFGLPIKEINWSKEGVFYGKDMPDEILTNIGQRNYPSLCIDKNNYAEIHWIYKNSDGLKNDNLMTIKKAGIKFETIISGCHSIVYNGRSVFDEENKLKLNNPIEPVIYERTGLRIADWKILENENYHHNELITDSQSKLLRERCLVGYSKGTFFFVLTQTPMNLKTASELMVDLGCELAINMDGGNLSAMNIKNFNGGNTLFVSTNNGVERKIGSAICAYWTK